MRALVKITLEVLIDKPGFTGRRSCQSVILRAESLFNGHDH